MRGDRDWTGHGVVQEGLVETLAQGFLVFRGAIGTDDA